MSEILDTVNGSLDAGETVCIAVVTASDDGDWPVGSKWTYRAGADALTGPREIREPAFEALAAGRSGILHLSPGVEVYLDVLAPDPRLLVCGAGHIAQPLVRMALELGFRVTVVDDRDEYASPERFPGCDVVAGDFEVVLREIRVGADTFAVVITRGHAHDAECMQALAGRGAAYLGLIGSRRRVQFVLEELEERGVSRVALEEVHTPIGLPLGAADAAEIALSILAEIVGVRRLGVAAVRTLRAGWRTP